MTAETRLPDEVDDLLNTLATQHDLPSIAGRLREFIDAAVKRAEQAEARCVESLKDGNDMVRIWMGKARLAEARITRVRAFMGEVDEMPITALRTAGWIWQKLEEAMDGSGTAGEAETPATRTTECGACGRSVPAWGAPDAMKPYVHYNRGEECPGSGKVASEHGQGKQA